MDCPEMFANNYQLSGPEKQNGVSPILYLRYIIMFLKPAV